MPQQMVIPYLGMLVILCFASVATPIATTSHRLPYTCREVASRTLLPGEVVGEPTGRPSRSQNFTQLSRRPLLYAARS
jgi:hypothetical protein